MKESITMPVSGRTNAKKVAGAIREQYRSNPEILVEISAIGYAAVANAVKGIIELNKLLASTGKIARTVPYMEDRPVKEKGQDTELVRTVTVFRLYAENT